MSGQAQAASAQSIQPILSLMQRVQILECLEKKLWQKGAPSPGSNAIMPGQPRESLADRLYVWTVCLGPDLLSIVA